MKNVQISFDENLLNAIDNIAASSQTSRSAVVRDALKNWIKQKEIKAFENDWIRKLKENRDDISDTDAWMDAEHWGDI
jgi:metal-responsive CopG/Arc/MetJ family transcriptional regulator